MPPSIKCLANLISHDSFYYAPHGDFITLRTAWLMCENDLRPTFRDTFSVRQAWLGLGDDPRAVRIFMTWNMLEVWQITWWDIFRLMGNCPSEDCSCVIREAIIKSNINIQKVYIYPHQSTLRRIHDMIFLWRQDKKVCSHPID